MRGLNKNLWAPHESAIRAPSARDKVDAMMDAPCARLFRDRAARDILLSRGGNSRAIHLRPVEPDDCASRSVELRKCSGC